MSELNNNEFENVTNNSSQKKKKEKKSNGVGKFFFTVLLGLSFGLCAALAFAGTNSVIKRHEAKVAKESQSEEIIEKNDEGTEKAVEKNVEEVAPKAPEEEKVQYDFSLNKVNSGLSVQEVAKEAMPSIVAITNKSIQELRSFYSMEIQEYESESAGSGIIVGKNDKELLIVTNAHVVADADTLSVCFIDGEAYEAVVKGTDTDNDLAVIAVDLSNISGSTLDEVKIATMGDSEKLEIGEQVVAIGNAMGYGHPAAIEQALAADSTTTFPVLNMLNTKYIICSQGAFAIRNVQANGNAWFVQHLQFVKDADAEMAALQQLDTKHAAVADERFRSALEGSALGEGRAQLTQYAPNRIAYTVESEKGGLLVFSEVYYPGWQATVDGQPAELGRVNYVLRAMKVSAGKHEVVLEFRPASVSTTNTVAYIAIALILLLLIGAAVSEVRRQRTGK